ncbi:putative dehydrogenase [Plesiocystis pacifica SIR-1]|uniref:Putative dehydrogenase n=1 Tax=Plesiocystis pacifica SIR-1 TaxID=391625 RepID=A6FZB7_9BACT|nr:C-terminal binding protein [Plesiocystis pacifica]EDM81001.1 putative dehydrogenase [Plesiocystis pacifica SIR-1]
MPRPVVAILDFEPGKHFAVADVEAAVLGSEVELRLLRARASAAVLPALADADAIIVWSRFELDADALATLERCRGIVCASVGYEHVDLEAARARGIPVCNVPDYGTEEVADHATALLLGLARKLAVLDRSVREGQWDWQLGGMPTRLRGQSLGVVGFGRIGAAFTRRAQAFGLEPAFFDPHVPSGVEKVLGVRRCESLDELLEGAQVLSIHASANPANRGLIGAEALAKLPRGALLINTARGSLVDTQAVVDALASGQLGGAGLDVLAEEPAPELHPGLLASPKVLLTPHAAWASAQSFAENRRKAARKAALLLQGRPVRDRVDAPFALPVPVPVSP